MKVNQPYVTSLNRLNRKKEHERITTYNMVGITKFRNSHKLYKRSSQLTVVMTGRNIFIKSRN